MSTLAGGAHAITAQFVSTDTNTFGNSTSGVLTQTVDAAGSATGVSADPTSPLHGQPVTFTATVTSFAATASGVVPTGTIQFQIDGSNFGDPVALNAAGQATSTAIASLSTAGHTVTAAYAGDVNYAVEYVGCVVVGGGSVGDDDGGDELGEPVGVRSGCVVLGDGRGGAAGDRYPDGDRPVLCGWCAVGGAGVGGLVGCRDERGGRGPDGGCPFDRCALLG